MIKKEDLIEAMKSEGINNPLDLDTDNLKKVLKRMGLDYKYLSDADIDELSTVIRFDMIVKLWSDVEDSKLEGANELKKLNDSQSGKNKVIKKDIPVYLPSFLWDRLEKYTKTFDLSTILYLTVEAMDAFGGPSIDFIQHMTETKRVYLDRDNVAKQVFVSKVV